ncbi:MAG: hypothetical protein FJZ97_13285 [Chloroflexi bacterium]|nr:hypothetical protein [Chloroflexota bacterium]
MSSNLFIRVPHRLLTDATWGRLNYRLKALAVQLALVAGDTDAEADGGILPETGALAWMLRQDAEELETDLVALEEVGYVERKGGRWYAAEFMRWQDGMTPGARRMRRLRAKQKAARSKDGAASPSDAPRAHGVRNGRAPTEPQPETEPETEAEPTTTPEALARERRVVVVAPSISNDPMIDLLEEQGVTEQVARRLSKDHKVPDIKAGIQVAREYAQANGVSNFPGLVVRAIQEGWQPKDIPDDPDWGLCPDCRTLPCSCVEEAA